MKKIIDTDALFEKFVRNYMKENAGKFTEEEWEDKIPSLYEEFAAEPLAELGGKTPVGYFADMSGEELVSALKDCVEGHTAVSDYMCEAIIASPETEKPLLKLLDGDGEELIMYALNLLSDKNSTAVLPRLTEFILDGSVCGHVKELCAEMLISRPEEAKENVLRLYNDGGEIEKEYFADMLSRCKPDERIYEILSDAFVTHPDGIPFYASLLARYGDERALPLLYEAINGKVNYNEFQELKFAIEKLGGEYEEKRDFSSDALYKKIMNKKA